MVGAAVGSDQSTHVLETGLPRRSRLRHELLAMIPCAAIDFVHRMIRNVIARRDMDVPTRQSGSSSSALYINPITYHSAKLLDKAIGFDYNNDI